MPHFGLPMGDTLLRGTDTSTLMTDLEMGNMFLNFILAEEARQLVGLNMTPFFEE